MNFTAFGFSSAAGGIIITAIIVNYFEETIPFIGEVFRYGKFTKKDKKSILQKYLLDIPKSYFKHFYWVAVISSTYTLYQATNVYIFEKDVPEYLFNFLDAATEKGRKSQISATHLYLVLCLFTSQVYRRFYDTHFVSIFGKNSRMNILHYTIGMLFYPGAAIALLSEAPKFSNNTEFASNEIHFSKLTYIDYFAVALFLWAWWHQHTTTNILANLRKNKKGEVVTSEHKLPFGDWFEYFSSPPQIAEILMYSALTIILVYHITWFFVFAFVLINQVETICLCHWWYASTFKNFPKKRKALIPGVY